MSCDYSRHAMIFRPRGYIRNAITMTEGALTKYFDLPPGKWRINSTVPGFKVVAVAIEGLRRRPCPLRQIEASEFTALVPFDDKNGEPTEPPAMLRGLPTLYYYYGQTLYLWSVPRHAWRLKVDYAPREETPTRNAVGEFTGASKLDL
jgi:hypothetical protein